MKRKMRAEISIRMHDDTRSGERNGLSEGSTAKLETMKELTKQAIRRNKKINGASAAIKWMKKEEKSQMKKMKKKKRKGRGRKKVSEGYYGHGLGRRARLFPL